MALNAIVGLQGIGDVLRRILADVFKNNICWIIRYYDLKAGVSATGRARAQSEQTSSAPASVATIPSIPTPVKANHQSYSYGALMIDMSHLRLAPRPFLLQHTISSLFAHLPR